MQETITLSQGRSSRLAYASGYKQSQSLREFCAATLVHFEHAFERYQRLAADFRIDMDGINDGTFD